MREEFVLVVDDDPQVQGLLTCQLEVLKLPSRPCGTGKEAIEHVNGHPHPDLVLLDIEMPDSSGIDLLKQFKRLDDELQVVMITGRNDIGTVRRCLKAGAYDYLTKPFDLQELANVTEGALEKRRFLRRSREHQERLHQYQRDLERLVREQTDEIRRTSDITLLTLAKLAESRDSETGWHLERIAAYSRKLARWAMRSGAYGQLGNGFVEGVHKSSPLHDIGKVGIPDTILKKPGPLSADEIEIMRTHTTIGGDTLRSILDRYKGPTFLTMAMEIAYGHHERWDGNGYPWGRKAEEIPLPARIVAVADAYDAITSARPYKPALSHQEAVRRITIDRGLHFDPTMVDLFLEHEAEFAAIQQEMKDRPPEVGTAVCSS